MTEDEKAIESEIQAKELNAPRLTSENVDSVIVGEAYHVFPGTTLTVCCLVLRNGFSVTGESAAAVWKILTKNWAGKLLEAMPATRFGCLRDMRCASVYSLRAYLAWQTWQLLQRCGMEKRVRIENADLSDSRIVVEIWKCNALLKLVCMDYPADLREFTVSSDQYLVVREARTAPINATVPG